MNDREWLISAFMLMSVLLTAYAPAELLSMLSPMLTATPVGNSSH